jgi:hypothetical protein
MPLPSSTQTDPQKRVDTRDIVTIATVLVILLVAAVYLLSGVATLSDAAHREGAYRIAILWALAYCAGGFLVGFLFGIPRVLQANDAGPAGKESRTPAGYSQRVNTNLEQISDWLTKIIVGLGLVQLRKIPQNLYDAATWMARSFMEPNGDLARAASLSTSIIVFFSVTGFLGGYLVTRLFFAGAFRRADTETTETVRPSTFGGDDQAKQTLAKFWKPDGKKIDPNHEKWLVDWMTKHGLISGDRKVSIGLFINSRAFQEQRAKAVQELPQS